MALKADSVCITSILRLIALNEIDPDDFSCQLPPYSSTFLISC